MHTHMPWAGYYRKKQPHSIIIQCSHRPGSVSTSSAKPKDATIKVAPQIAQVKGITQLGSEGSRGMG